MGALNGPCVSCKGIRTPHLKVTGLPEGAFVKAETSRGTSLEFFSNGLHRLGDELDWIRCSVLGVSIRHMTVCEVTSKAA